MPRSDFSVSHHGSVCLVAPETREARVHLEAHTDGLWFGAALAVEPRYLEPLCLSLQDDGFTLHGVTL